MADSNHEMCNMLSGEVAGDKLYDAFAHRHGRRHVTRAEYDQRTQRFYKNKQMIEVVCFCILLIRMTLLHWNAVLLSCLSIMLWPLHLHAIILFLVLCL